MRRPTDVGAMRHRVTFRRPDGPGETRRAGGQLVDDAADVATVWAKVEPVAGSGVFTAEQLQPSVTHVVTVRYREDVLLSGEQWEIVHRGRVFRIEEVRDVDERRRFLWIQCVEQKGRAE